MKVGEKKFMTSAIDWINLFILCTLAFLYIGGTISPAKQNFVWSFNFIIPVALLINIFLLIVNLIFGNAVGIAYFAVLLLGHNYLSSSVGFKYLFKENKQWQDSFTVLNFNVSALYTLSSEVKQGIPPNTRAVQIRNFILENDADVQCYQEFLTLPDHEQFDIIKGLTNRGYEIHFSRSQNEYTEQHVGILIASKFPIVGKGDIVTSIANQQFHFNRIMYVDLKIQKDTVRVINFHLTSMALKTLNPLTKVSFNDMVSNSMAIFSRLKGGVVDRSHQVDDMVEFVKRSPYRVICAGDLNDLPYTYSYQQIRKILSNTFEDCGRGFGFTYNGQLLRTLRIDNQFYSKGIVPLDFQTLREINCSDHFPVIGSYKIAAKRE